MVRTVECREKELDCQHSSQDMSDCSRFWSRRGGQCQGSEGADGEAGIGGSSLEVTTNPIYANEGRLRIRYPCRNWELSHTKDTTTYRHPDLFPSTWSTSPSTSITNTTQLNSDMMMTISFAFSLVIISTAYQKKVGVFPVPLYDVHDKIYCPFLFFFLSFPLVFLIPHIISIIIILPRACLSAFLSLLASELSSLSDSSIHCTIYWLARWYIDG